MNNKATSWLFALLLGSSVLGISCGSTPPPAPAPSRLAVADMPDVDSAAVLTRITTLASDDFEGRAPGSRGEELTSEYLIKQFTQLGLTPGAADGTFVQKVPLVGITADGAPLVLKKGATELRLKWKDDVVAWTKHVADTASLKDSELVFVGYGVVAPEYNWDDYKGLDVRGKTIVMLVNDPPVPDPANPFELDPKTFGGKAMTYYGRWTYKYEIAAQKGAAGAIIVHETGPAGYPFEVLQDSNIGEKFDLVTPNKNMDRAAIEAWVTVDRGRDILKMAGQNYDELKKLAATRDFKPVPLGVTASMTLHNKLRTIDSRNFVAKIEGSDPKLKDECVVYTAHWDHLGIGPAVNGDKIYNGAVDNASGVAGLLEIAHAYTKLTAPPKRSILFVAVTAEEQGLLGSEYYAANPVVPLAKTLANINMDGLNVHGRTKDITLIGYGASDLDDYARDAAAEQGRTIRSDPEPEKGFYYRSDHFNFAKLGVPALDPDEGVDFIGKPAGYSQKVRDDYTEHDYHKPSDQVKPDWDLSGAREDLKLFFAVGYRVAEADKFPEWKPGNEFKAKRDAMLSAGAAPAAAPAAAGPVDPVTEVTDFRARHEADYTKEYVPLAGLFFLHAGANTAGSAAGAVVQLPKRAPASIGRFTYQNKHVRFEPQPGAPVTLKGKPVTAPIDLKSDDESSDYEELAIGDLAFWLHESGDRRAIRMRDPESDIA
jgi:Zn-dependent M28 family amino/carboxypeptidase